MSTAFELESTPRARWRERLPPKRVGFTQEARIGGDDCGHITVVLRTGEYADGRLGEIFIDLQEIEISAGLKAAAARPDHVQFFEQFGVHASIKSWANCFAMAISHALQYGVPLENLVEQFTFTRFEPSGKVHGDPQMPLCTSVVDYVFRTLGVHYLGWTHLAHQDRPAL